MKITEFQLKRIIKEELLAEAKDWKSSWRDNKKGVSLPAKPKLYQNDEISWQQAKGIFKYFHFE